MLESGGSRGGKKADFASASIGRSLLKREWRGLIRTPAFAFQCFGGTILAPVVLAFVAYSLLGGEEGGYEPVAAGMLVMLVSMLSVGMNIGASTAFSREGTGLGTVKALPVTARTLVKAKMSLYTIISSVAVTLSLVVFAVAVPDPVSIVGAVAFFYPYNYAFNCFCVRVDLAAPKLRWTSPNEAVKNNRNAMMTMFINMGFGVAAFVLVTVAGIFAPTWGRIVMWVALCAAAVTAAAVFHRRLYSQCEELLEHIEI